MIVSPSATEGAGGHLLRRAGKALGTAVGGESNVARTLSRGHNGAVADIAVDPNGTYLCSCSDDGAVKIWNIDLGSLVHDLCLHDSYPCSASCVLAIAPVVGVSGSGVETLVFAAGHTRPGDSAEQGVLSCWQVCTWGSKEFVQLRATKREPAPLFQIDDHGSGIAHLALLPGDRLATASVDGLIWILDLKGAVEGDTSKDVILHSMNYSSITALLIVRCRFPHTSKVVVGTETGRISIWSDDNLLPDREDMGMLDSNMKSRRNLDGGATSPPNKSSGARSPLKFASASITGLGSMARMRKRVFFNSFKDSVSLLDNNVQPSSTVPKDPPQGSFSSVDSRLSKNRPLCEYWAHGKRALQGSGVSSFAVLEPGYSLQPGQHILFSSSGDTTVKMWWLGKSECLATFRGHTAAVTKLAVIDAEVTRLFSASNDMCVISWLINVKEPKQSHRLRTFRGHDSIITDILLIRVPEFVRAAEHLGRDRTDTLLTRTLADYDSGATSKEPLIERNKDLGSMCLLTASRDGTVKSWDLRFEAGHEDDEPSRQTVFRSGSEGVNRLIEHDAQHLGIEGARSDGLGAESADDKNVLAACGNGHIPYIDMFPSPLKRMTFRSASAYEVVSPFLDWATLMYQKIGFLLPTIFILTEITHKHISSARLDRIVDEKQQAYTTILSSSIRKSLGIRPYLHREETFKLEVIVAMCTTILFILVMTGGLYPRLTRQEDQIMHSKEYVEELATVYVVKARQLQTAHKRVRYVKNIKSILWAFLWGTTKLLTIPILIRVYSLIDCPVMEDGQRHLSLLPDVICFEGNHLYAFGVSFFMVLIYIGLVMPFTFVGCDADVWYSVPYIQDLLRNAAINAMSVEIAFLTPGGLNWCWNQFAEFLMKATLPAVFVLQNQHHLVRGIMITSVFFLEMLVVIIRPPYRHPDANLVTLTLKFLPVYLAACTIYGGYCADRLAAAPYMLPAMWAGTAVILIVATIWYCMLKRRGVALKRKLREKRADEAPPSKNVSNAV